MPQDYFEATPEQIAKWLRRVRGEGEEQPPPPSEEPPPLEEEKLVEIKKEPPAEEEKQPEITSAYKEPVVVEKFLTQEVELPHIDAYQIPDETLHITEKSKAKFTPEQARKGIIYSIILGKPKAIE